MGNKVIIEASIIPKVENIKSATDTIKQAFSNAEIPVKIGKGFSNIQSKLENEIKQYNSLTSKQVGLQDYSAIEKSGRKIIELYRRLGIEFENIRGLEARDLFPPDTLKKIKQIESAIKHYNSIVESSSKERAKKTELLASYKVKKTSAEEKRQSILQRRVVDQQTYNDLKERAERTQRELDIAYAQMEEAKRTASLGRDKIDFRTKAGKNYKKTVADYESIKQQQEQAQEAFDSVIIKKIQDLNLGNANKHIAEYTDLINQYERELAQLSQNGDANALQKTLSAMGDIEGIDPSAIHSIQDLREALSTLEQDASDQVNKGVEEMGRAMQETNPKVDKFNEGLNDSDDAYRNLKKEFEDVNQLKDRLRSFFSISNQIELFKRAVRGAIDTIKELDATMTEAAVVTDFSVSDMWKKLPQYSDEASQLGASINDLYGATTLYYQQGLQTNAAMALGVETMKMARIAGMESTEATEAMTAA